MNIGNRIAQLRRNAGMSQEELADLLFVSRTLVAKWESGKRRPDMKSIEMLADVFSVPPGYIIERNDAVTRELGKSIPPDIDLSAAELAEKLNSFLMTVPERDRNVFIRRYHFFEKPDQIADYYGLTANNVGIILFRTRKKLRSYLKKGGQ